MKEFFCSMQSTDKLLATVVITIALTLLGAFGVCSISDAAMFNAHPQEYLQMHSFSGYR